MTKKHFLMISILVLLIPVFSACSGASKPAESADPTATRDEIKNTDVPPTATIEPTEDLDLIPEATGNCENPFYPIRSDVTWTYSMTSPGEPDLGSYTLSYGNISPDSYDSYMSLTDPETGEIFNASATWSCSNDGILSSDFATINVIQFDGINYDTLEYEGIFLPPAEQWEIGKSWDAYYLVNTDFSVEGLAFEANMEINITNTIAAVEEVNVPAGVFSDAYRVDSTGTISVLLEGDLGVTIPDLPLEYSAWFVEDVGIVKQTSADMDLESSQTELVSME